MSACVELSIRDNNVQAAAKRILESTAPQNGCASPYLSLIPQRRVMATRLRRSCICYCRTTRTPKPPSLTDLVKSTVHTPAFSVKPMTYTKVDVYHEKWHGPDFR